MATASNENNLTEEPAETTAGAAPEAAADKPRGRGRPKGSGAKASAGEKPAIETLLEGQEAPEPSAAKPQQKKRGPKTGSKTDVAAMAKQLVGVHSLVAMITGIPEVQLHLQEAEQLASAISNVCDEYGLSISGKTGAALQLAAAAAMIYGPRALVISSKIAAAKAAAARDVTPNAAAH